MSLENDYLISGASGFLGKYFVEYFRKNKIAYKTLGRKKSNDLFFDFLHSNHTDFKPEIFKTFIHLASKAHVVPKTKLEEDEFYNINFNSVKNLLYEFDKLEVRFQNIIYVSSVSVYGLTEGENIFETAPLKATDPYGKSKILAEELIQEWCKRKNINCTILRLPLVFGKNPPGNLGNLLSYLKEGKYFHIKNGSARKSIVCAWNIPENLKNFEASPGIYNLTDRHHPSFKELTEKICDVLSFKKPKNLSYSILVIAAKIGDVMSLFMKFPFSSSRLEKMSSSLTFNDDLARKTFNWSPSKVLDNINALK